MSNKVELTKKDLYRCINRYMFTRQSPFNYETMQSGGWVYSIHPAMEKIYGDDPDLLAKKYEDHFKFYNTQPWFGNLILGACIAIESTKEPDATQTAVDMRTALMGPLAGLGDAIIFVMFATVFGAIAAYSALEGSIFGWVIAQTFGTVLWIIFYRLFFTAYKQGVEFVTSRSAQLKRLTDAAAVLGLSVVGALVVTTVKVHFGFSWTIGEVTQNLDDLVNSIIPNFANVLTVILIYFGLDIKKMTSAKMIIIVLVVAIVLSAFGILA